MTAAGVCGGVTAAISIRRRSFRGGEDRARLSIRPVGRDDIRERRTDAAGAAGVDVAHHARLPSAILILALVIILGEWTGLARSVLGSPLYAALLDISLSGLLIGVLASAARTHLRPRLHPLDLAIGAYFLLAVVEIVNPNVPSVMVGLEGFRKTAFMMLGYLTVRLFMRPDASLFYRCVALGSIPALLWAIRQYFAPLPVELGIVGTSGASPISFHSGPILRAFAPTAGPFHLGIIGGAVLVVAVICAARTSSRWIVPAVIAAAAIGLSLTRANIIAAIVALAAVTAAAGGLHGRLRTAGAASAAVAVLITAALLPSFPLVGSSAGAAPGQSGSAVVTPRPGATRTPNVVPPDLNPIDDRSMQFRFSYWTEQLKAISQRPLTGYGTSSAADGFDRLYKGTNRLNFAPHSIYFKAALEMGLFGLALLIAILAGLLWAAFRLLASDRFLALVSLGVVVLPVVSGLTGPMLDAYPFNLFFWVTAGLLVTATADRSAALRSPAPSAS